MIAKSFRLFLTWVVLLPALARAQLVNDGATNTLANVTTNLPGSLTVGTNGSFTLLVLSNNCLLSNSGLAIIGFDTAARFNEVRLISPTARWSLNNALFVGSGGSANRLVVSNGGLVENISGVIGGGAFTASNNVVLVTGAGSTWSNSNTLRVGDVGPGNQLVVSNGGTVFTGTNLTVGVNTTFSLNNRVTVDGGTLRVTNVAGTAVYNVRRGTNVLNAGLIEVDRLILTNLAGVFEFNDGVLAAGSVLDANGQAFRIGRASGSTAATLRLTGNGPHTFGSGISVNSNAWLTGNGTIVGAVNVDPGGTVAPGASIGRITLSTEVLSLQGVVLMEISRNGSLLTNDQIQVPGATIPYGGTLRVTNVGPTTLAIGDRFPLFAAGSYGGSFSTVILPPLNPGLGWTNKLLVDGSIEVRSAPPAATTLPASALRLTGVQLNGEILTARLATTAWFEWGPTTNLGNTTTPVVVPGSPGSVSFSADIAGQFQGQTNYVRLVATNILGRGNGAMLSFAIPAFPGVPGAPPLRSSAYNGSQTSVASFEARPEWDREIAMTIEAWVYREEADRIETIVAHGGPGSYMLGFSPRLRFHRGTNFAEVPNVVPVHKWTHVAAGYDGAIVRFYINGEIVGARALSNTGAGKLRPLVLGDDGGIELATLPQNHFHGSLDEVRIWSVARTGAELLDGLYREVRGEPGLAAVFPRGGRIEEISGLVGTIGGGVTEQVFGMVPRDLVVPRAALPPNPDGNVNVDSEYLGADQLVVRYPDDPATPDGVAYFVHTTNDLFVGVRGLRANDAGWDPTNSTLGLFIDPTYERPPLAGPTQAVLRVTRRVDLPNPTLLSGDRSGGYVQCVNGSQPCVPASFWSAGSRACDGDFLPPCAEFRVSRAFLGSFDEFDGVALGHFAYTPFADSTLAPETGFAESPATWLTMSYGEGSANVPRVRWGGRVFAGLTTAAPPLTNYLVQLFTSTAAYSARTDHAGVFTFDVPMPPGLPLNGQASTVSFGRFAKPMVHANAIVISPLSVFTNGVTFPPIPPGSSGTFNLAGVDFFVQPPLAAAAITAASPASPQCGQVVRQGEAGGPGDVVTLLGTNLHAEMEFYLAPVSATFPNSPGAWTLIPAQVVRLTNDRTSVVIQAPFVPRFVPRETNGPFVPSFDASTQWRWVAHDTWFRPGRIEYSVVGDFTLRAPPYPIVHGFRFPNQGAGGRLGEFLACYGENAYIGDCPACVPDPLYWLGWYFVYDYWMKETGGSCVGMASTAVQIFDGFRRASDFDPLAFAANGIEINPPVFPGEYDTDNFGGRETRPPIPKDIWAVIRANHGVQTTLEYLWHGLGQTKSVTSFSGFPTARLNEIRSTPGVLTVAIQLDGGNGHCVTPYRVEDNFGGDPNRSRIWVYDNEKPCVPPTPVATSPCVNDAFIDVDLGADQFTFGATTGNGMFTMPVDIYNGRHTSPHVLLNPILPGGIFEVPQLMMLFMAGGADAHYSSPQGEWGWRADGTFVDNLPGLRAVVPLGSATNRTHSIPVFFARTNNTPLPGLTVQMNVRSSRSNLFHASENGISLQLESAEGTPGQTHRITLGLESSQLASFRFTPQTAVTNFTPRVGFQLRSNASAVFQWAGLDAEGGHAQEFRALRDRRAVEFRNFNTRPKTHVLRVDAVDGGTTNNASVQFGPFTVPPGAVHCVVLHEWPQVGQVRSELDLDGDGTPDQVTVVTGVEIDTDGDGMPDAWEIRHRLNPESALGDDGPDGDPDGDGVNNLGEYLADTDPRDASSALRLTAALLPGNRVRLTWAAVPGRRYEILHADDLWQVFRPLPNAGFPRVATGVTEQFDDLLPSPAIGTRFYRLRLSP